MRICELQLIRYGKFTDRAIVLPKCEQDFHFVVGPNEAGKSTIRTAISELLFGMPRSSPMAFVHPQPELLLGAVIKDADEALEFHRTKATKSSLRTLKGEPLQDDVLARFLGTADRAFFEQMFGLDHNRLVAGGQSILDASKDVSQVLFQSAAGIAGFGRVKDALAEEAAKLWAPRKAADRAYYAAAAKLDEATLALKGLTVRTKVWVDAQARLVEVEARISEVREEKRGLDTKRALQERVRRLASTVRTLQQKSRELQELSDVIDLPADAASILRNGHAQLSIAETVFQQREEDVARYTLQRDGFTYDQTIIQLQEDIESVEAFRHRVRDHADDLGKQSGEVERLLEKAREGASELGWPVTDAELRAALPSSADIRAVDRLVKSHGSLFQAKANAARALKDRQCEFDELINELQDVAIPEVSVMLRSALSEAQVYKNTTGTQATLEVSVDAAKRELGAAVSALGQWQFDTATLRELPIPSTERLTELTLERQRLTSEVNSALARVNEAQAEAQNADLAVKQYSEARHVVTAVEVCEARERRDDVWGSLKAGRASIETTGPLLDAAIVLADELVDSQLASATEAAELQSLRHRAERAATELSRLNQRLLDKRDALSRFDAQWLEATRQFGMEGLELSDAAAWMKRREMVLTAATHLDDKSAELAREQQASNSVGLALHHHLYIAGNEFEEAVGLPVLVAAAEQLIGTSDAAIARRNTLTKQIESTQRTLARLQEETDTADATYERWLVEWTAALAAAKLTNFVKDVVDAETALLLVERVRVNLMKAAETKRDRIDTMKADLKKFEEQAQVLTSKLGDTSLNSHSDASVVVRTMSERLQEAIAARQRWNLANEARETAITQRGEAQREVERAKALMRPLLDAAGVATPAEAFPFIERSDLKRQLLADVQTAWDALTKDTDGVGPDAIIAEVDACDLTSLPSEIAATSAALDAATDKLTKLAEERLQADQVVNAISGQKDAAVAEAKRQEALAEMADASERYLKLATATKLLRWAIDRYRDRKQGPMLSRAGAIFSMLTLGRYTKLFVDYDKQPLTLFALRDGGNQVEVSGMSEGTRDQLYLALRLAALELHIEQSKALPFVADDLFINFDDERSRAGLEALRELSQRTQVLFLSHHDHLLPLVRQVFGSNVNVVTMPR